MKLPQTKFNIGDNVIAKGSFNIKNLKYIDSVIELAFYQVSEIRTVTCYIGTQILYYVKPKAIAYWPNVDYESKQKFLYRAAHGFRNNKNMVTTKELSEPELELFNVDKLPNKILKDN